MAGPENDSWERLGTAIDSLRSALSRSKGVHVGAASVRDSAKALVQLYFRETRPRLLSIGCSEDTILSLDGEMQDLLRLSAGRNRRSSYVRVVKRVHNLRNQLAAERELRLGEKVGTEEQAPTQVEARILATLQGLVPSAALSYEQALRDLATGDRRSYRGTANELRESLREVLDYLAPDDKVMKSEGFKLETGQSKPTQRQKVRHILASRNRTGTQIKAPSDAVALADELASSVARSSYQGTSVSAHIAGTRGDVQRIKMYVDSVLADILELHH